MTETAKRCACSVRLLPVLCLTAAIWPLAAGQPPASSAAPPDQPEISTHEEKATFTSHVNLVMVPVVVRDKRGRPIDGLTKESFRLYDKGKLQEIERFVVEKPGNPPTPALPVTEPKFAGEDAPAHGSAAVMPRRFIGYLFDDVHLDVADLMQAKAAASRHIESELKPTDRAALFTTSGQGTVDFTDDRDQLREGLARLVPRPIARAIGQECPDISYMQADLIVNRQDADATNAAIVELASCLHTYAAELPKASVLGPAQRVLLAGEQETQVSLAVLKDAIRRMSAMPGERVLVLVSPGFLTLAEHQQDESDAIERALHANVIVNALNARGVYTTNIDASRVVLDSGAERTKQILRRQSEMLQEAMLAEVAADTGGTYFHNNNDLDEGLRRTSSTPEVYYLLGFQPQNLKLDGSFHGLKVALGSKGDYTSEARRGYYAPKHLEDAAATAQREIEDAIYSSEEMSELPVSMHTQFLKGAGDAAKVTVLAHLDLAGVKFRNVDGRNLNNITVVAALFDRNGKFVNGAAKHVDLRLRDQSLQYRVAQGLTVRLGMEASPGSYVVRLLVRDSEGQMMSAINEAVDVP